MELCVRSSTYLTRSTRQPRGSPKSSTSRLKTSSPLALADQLAARNWIARRGARSSEREFLWALDQTPDAAPTERD